MTENGMARSIPIVDFAKCGLLIDKDEEIYIEDLQSTGDELYTAFSTYGFTYLKNHGIPWSRVDELNDVGEKLFALPVSEKTKFHQSSLYLSYDPVGRSKSDCKKFDHNEGFRTTGRAFTDDNVKWPEVPGLKECYTRFADTSAKLLMRLMKVLAYGMRLKDKEYFCKSHSLINQDGNLTDLKIVKYPPIEGEDWMENRVGEHTDKTTVTLLFQDQMGGLQVRDKTGHFVDVEPIPDTIILNIGDILQAWSGNRLKSNRHRVGAPYIKENRNQIRRSIIYFGKANNDVLLQGLEFEDGVEEKFEVSENPITVKEYVERELGKILRPDAGKFS